VVATFEGDIAKLGGGGSGGTAGEKATGRQELKATNTVLKWGGGYSDKKDKGKDRENKHKKRKSGGDRGKGKSVCNFGASCNRSDCWFSHPGTGPNEKSAA
jgi:hypothetical protein